MDVLPIVGSELEGTVQEVEYLRKEVDKMKHNGETAWREWTLFDLLENLTDRSGESFIQQKNSTPKIVSVHCLQITCMVIRNIKQY